MPPRAKKTTAATAPAGLNGKRPATVKRSDLDVLRAEVAAELPSPEMVAVPFCGTTVRILDFWDWPAEANETLARGLIVRWASQVMPPEDFAVWQGKRPTNRQAAEFIASIEEVVGFPLGAWLTSLAS